MRTNKPIGLTFLYAIYRFYVTGSCVVVTFVLLYCFHRDSLRFNSGYSDIEMLSIVEASPLWHSLIRNICSL